jgi:hypothetical protein
MKTINVSFEVSEERLLACLALAGKHSGLELSEDLDLDQLALELSEDVANYIGQDLAGFIEEGLNNDLYQDCFNFVEDEDRDEE